MGKVMKKISNIKKFLFLTFLIFILVFSWKNRPRFQKYQFMPVETLNCPKKVFYLKTHKTASSSVLNILARYAENRNLKVALPKFQSASSFIGMPFTTQTLDLRSFPPDIHFLHSIFNFNETKMLFPKIETLYVTILRNTSTQYRSTFRYFGLGYRNRAGLKPLSIEEFIIDAKKNPSNKSLPYLTRNPMFEDLGFPSSKLKNLKDIDRAIKKIDKIFDLVMITELWDESLILLQRKLCLSMTEVVVFDINEELPIKKKNVQGSDDIIIDFNKADHTLYNYFYTKLLKQANTINPEEIEELKKSRELWSKICIAGRIPKIAYGSKLYLGYKLKEKIPIQYNSTCVGLTRSELEYLSLFRSKLS